MDSIIRRTIRRCSVELIECSTNIEALSLRLFAQEVLGDSTRERILNHTTLDRKMEEMLSVLMRKGEREFRIFLRALLETDNQHCHDCLLRVFEELGGMESSLNQGNSNAAATPPTASNSTAAATASNSAAPPAAPPTASNSTAAATASNSAAPPAAPPTASSSRPEAPRVSVPPINPQQDSLRINNTPFIGIHESAQRSIVQFELLSPSGNVPCELILASLQGAAQLRKITFKSVTFTGEYTRKIVLPKLETVHFLDCKIPKSSTWKNMIFFAKTQPQATSNTDETIWNMDVDISVNNSGLRMLEVEREPGLLAVNSKSGFDMRAILEGITSRQTQLKRLTTTGFKPIEFDLSQFSHLRELKLLNVEIGVKNDMVILRQILSGTKGLTTLHCSIGDNKYSELKTVVVHLTKILSAPSMEKLKLENFNLKHTDGKIIGNGPTFPKVTSCEFHKCTLDGPIRERFRQDFPRVDLKSRVLFDCTDEAGRLIALI